MQVNEVISILKNLRVNGIYEEYEIQNEIYKTFNQYSIDVIKEYKLGCKNRIDFFLPQQGIGIEVKKGKPGKKKVIDQLERYAVFKEITTLILVVERNMDVPKMINGKPCFSIGLNKQWGIAL